MKFKLIAPFRTYFYINIGFRSFLKNYYSENNDYYKFWNQANSKMVCSQNQTDTNSQNGQSNEQQCEFESKNHKLEFKKQKCEFENGTKCKLKDIRKYKFEDVKKCRVYQDIEKSIEVEFLHHLDSTNQPDPPVSRYAEISSNDLAFNEKIEMIECTVKQLPKHFLEKEKNSLKKIECFLDCNSLKEPFDGSEKENSIKIKIYDYGIAILTIEMKLKDFFNISRGNNHIEDLQDHLKKLRKAGIIFA
ncbi:MAG: hypothetical protein QNJ72_35460 [Pleurocapsa sp. MO_226.B13]|nr:hypothetical protein [Pleurocapsa sp. MO_226.B13]